MKRSELAQRIAHETGISHAEAADQLDEAVAAIVRRLKDGQSARLPGLGRLRRDPTGVVRFTPASVRRPNGAR